jgi:hypothetical protein
MIGLAASLETAVAVPVAIAVDRPTPVAELTALDDPETIGTALAAEVAVAAPALSAVD